jgi:hypothetical protein
MRRMEPGVTGVNWQVAGGAMLGGAVAVGTLLGLSWWKRRARAARGDRPPQEEKILRPAGYFAMCKLDELSDKLLDMILQSLAGGVVCGVIGLGLWPLVKGLASGQFTLGQVWAEPKAGMLAGVVALGCGGLFWMVRSLQVLWKLEEEIRRWRFGMRGEQAVAEKLARGEVAAAGYRVFHDLPAESRGKKFNIDHVVVGPGGVFVLETKARPRRKAKWDQPEHVVIFDGEVLQFPWCYDKKAPRQVEASAAWLGRLLEGYAPRDVRIHPVIVVPGWFAREPQNHRIRVMNAEYLVEHIARAKPIYEERELAPVVRRLDEACRTLEF